MPIIVANPGTVPIKVQMYPMDAMSGQKGGAIYLSDADPKKDVGAWIKLEATEVDVPPQKQTTVNFTIDIPAGVSVGQHLGGIAAQLEQPNDASTPGGTSFGITTDHPRRYCGAGQCRRCRSHAIAAHHRRAGRGCGRSAHADTLAEQ